MSNRAFATGMVATLFVAGAPSAFAASPPKAPDLTVAADGSGAYRTVQAAIDSAPSGTPDRPTVIRLHPGVYHEAITVPQNKRYLCLIGDDPQTTVVSGGATVGADDLSVQSLGLSSDSLPTLHVEGDRDVFRNCRFVGGRTAVLDDRGRHFYADCTMRGGTDIIAGGGAGYFEHCRIDASVDGGCVTAAATAPAGQPHGFDFSNCTVEGTSPAVHIFLGRPASAGAQVTWMNCMLGEAVQPEGWTAPDGRHDDVLFAECHNFGPGASTKKRVAWIRKLPAAAADALTPERVLAGDDHWNPRAGLAYGGTLRPDIVYGKAGGERLLLDASVPDTGRGPFPILILVHGGGWSGGDKEGDLAPLLAPVLSSRFTWFTIAYRLAPEHRWPACQDDVATAIRWVKAHAAEYHGDPGRIALIGYSAGGQLVTRAAVGALPDLAVAAVVGCAPPTDMEADTARRGGLSTSLMALFGRTTKDVDPAATALMREMSAIDHIAPPLPPFLLVHGSADVTVPYEQSLHFQARLREAGAPCELLTIPDAPHGIAQWEHHDAAYREKIADWLERTLRSAKGPSHG